MLKKHSESVDNPPIRIYVNRIKNRITFKIKSGYYLELLTPETMKLLGSAESKITKDKNGKNVPRLEVVEIKIWFTDQTSAPLELEDKIDVTLIIK